MLTNSIENYFVYKYMEKLSTIQICAPNEYENVSLYKNCLSLDIYIYVYVCVCTQAIHFMEKSMKPRRQFRDVGYMEYSKFREQTLSFN